MNYKEKRLKKWKSRGVKIEDWQEFDELYSKAGGKCEICDSPLSKGDDPEHAPASLDHDHETGEIRGILCSIHNYDIWKVERYPDEELIGLAKYLLKIVRMRGESPSLVFKDYLKEPNESTPSGITGHPNQKVKESVLKLSIDKIQQTSGVGEK